MYAELIAIGFLVGEYVYHRWGENHSAPKWAGTSFSLPASQLGVTVPIFYGTIRTKSPFLAWWSTAQVSAGGSFTPTLSGTAYVYGIDMLYVLGLFFQGGTAAIRAIWSGERKLGGWPFFLTGNGGHTPGEIGVSDTSALPGDSGFEGGQFQYMNGNPSQVYVDGSGTSQCYAADKMVNAGVPAATIPSYRGMLSISLFGAVGSSFPGWIVGSTPQPNALSFEVVSRPAGNGYGLIGDTGSDGAPVEVNPVDILYDIFTGTYGKLGISPSRIDSVSWAAAAATLATEGHGMSRSWEAQTTARDIVDEILRQIDGTIYYSHKTGLICLKLIRADYTPDNLFTIQPENCVSLEGFTSGGWIGLINKVVVHYTDRSNNYRDNIATAQHEPNAAGQDGEIHELTLSFPGVCTQALAQQIAARELQARCRPLMKMRAIVTRAFLRHNPGDAIMVSWPEANISRVVFRIATVGQGTLESNKISLDLIQDYFYQWRRLTPQPPTHISFGDVMAFGG